MKIVAFFILFGLIGSVIMDLDHASYFVENPKLIRTVNTHDSFWNATTGVDGRNLHIPLFVSSILVTIYFWMREKDEVTK